MVANNAFMIKEMKEKVEKETRKQERELRKQDKIDIAKNLLDILDNETIALKTGLTIDEVSNLRAASEPQASN